ncbi:MAG: thymidine phosphorylase [Ignavibacteriales bacterium]|nr:thymidine phosphorylase [Ignavibacteriales bacterium]
MNPIEIIRKKRSGEKLNREEIENLINGYLNGRITDYQMSAFLMAVYFQKMDFEETAVLTEVMLRSGVVVDLAKVPGIKVDKHSTGGVGDKVSLILAPMVAACGVPVPMISGRGLGHTGGTLDKLESIPGFRTNLSLDEYKKVIADIGLVMIGQTNEIAPADKKMYALRDVTATVESIPLISGSIMSKKLAEGIDALVLDIKTGRGAFMQSENDAIELAKTLIAVGNKFGKKTIGFLTDMSQPLGYTVGNWLEVVECIECMQCKNIPDLMEVTYVLSGAMVMLGGKAGSIEEGISKCKNALQSGKALDKFKELVHRQDGDVSFITDHEKYPKSKYTIEVKSASNGYINNIDALEVGFIGIMLGAGRMKVDDVIDPKAGIVLKKKAGDSVTAGDTLAIIQTDKKEIVESAAHRLERAISVTKDSRKSSPLIRAMIDENGMHPWRNFI